MTWWICINHFVGHTLAAAGGNIYRCVAKQVYKLNIFQTFQLLSVFSIVFASSSDVCERNGQRYHIRRSYKNKVGTWSACHFCCLILPRCRSYIFLNPPSSWNAPRYILNMPETRHERVRKKFHILVDGDTIPFPIKSFREMKLPPGYITPLSLYYKHAVRSKMLEPLKYVPFFCLQQFWKAWKRRALFIPHQFKSRESPQCKYTFKTCHYLTVVHRLCWTLLL